MKATIVWIHTNEKGEWLVPPIVPGSDFYVGSSAIDALHYAQWQADIYNKKTGRVKFPSLSGESYLPRVRVEVGEKARQRLGIDQQYRDTIIGRNVFEFAVHNMMFYKSSPTALYGAWFGTIFRNGEWASICTQETRLNVMKSEVLWSNLRVMKMKEVMHFPDNPYMVNSKPPTPDPAFSNIFSDNPDITSDAMKRLTQSIKMAGRSFLEASDSMRAVGRDYPTPPFPPSYGFRVDDFPTTVSTERDPVTGQIRIVEHRLDNPSQQGEQIINQMNFQPDPRWFTTPNTLVEIDGNGVAIPPPQVHSIRIPIEAFDLLLDDDDDENDEDDSLEGGDDDE